MKPDAAAVLDQRLSHRDLLDQQEGGAGRRHFDAIVVPTHRPAANLEHAIDLAVSTTIPLIVITSGATVLDDVFGMMSRSGAHGLAMNVARPGGLRGITFRTSSPEFRAASPGWNQDLSIKRNLGLMLAKMMSYQRIMYLDDDIRFEGEEDDVFRLAAALSDERPVSVLIPSKFPDNSVVCHANRETGADQGVFASASGMGVTLNWESIGFFPDIYNEDWFFFAEHARRRRIHEVGESHQNPFDPFESSDRAAQEEFGDLIAEGLYAAFKVGLTAPQLGDRYWAGFHRRRGNFHRRVLTELQNRRDADLGSPIDSVNRAAAQLRRIDPALCTRFIQAWLADGNDWVAYLRQLPTVGALAESLESLASKAEFPLNGRIVN